MAEDVGEGDEIGWVRWAGDRTRYQLWLGCLEDA